MSRRKHAAHEEEHENHERWLLTYADLITLLLALFMMLYAMSVLDLEKYQAFQEAFTKGIGGNPTNAHEIAQEAPEEIPRSVRASGEETTKAAPALNLEELKELKKKLEKELKSAGLQDEIQMELQPRGLVMNVVSGVLFPSGSANLGERGEHLLGSLGVVFKSFANDLVVEGHTDSRPIRSDAFPSNWELSSSRSIAVLRYIIEKNHIAEKRVSAAGYSDTRPRTSNATEEGRAKNRRVDIVVLAAPRAVVAETATKASGTKKSTSSGHGVDASTEDSHAEDGAPAEEASHEEEPAEEESTSGH